MTEEQRYRQVEIAQIKVKQHSKRLRSVAEQREAASRAGHTARANGLTVTYEQRLRAYLPLLERLLQAYMALAASLLVAGDDISLMNLRQAILLYEQERDEAKETLYQMTEPTPVLAISYP